MKHTTKILLIIVLMLNLNCCSREVLKTEQWKEKYGIEPNTGVFIGKVIIREDWEKDSMFCFITNKEAIKVYAYDTISRSNNIIIITNLKPNKYYLYAYEAVFWVYIHT
jgi:hypothetical protein